MKLQENPQSKCLLKTPIFSIIEKVRWNTNTIIDELRWISKESRMIDFILHPWKYMNMLPGIYEEYPELKYPRKR